GGAIVKPRRVDLVRPGAAVREPLTGSSEISVRGVQPGGSWRERARGRPSTDRSPTTRGLIWRRLDRESQAMPTVRVLIWRRVRSVVASDADRAGLSLAHARSRGPSGLQRAL